MIEITSVPGGCLQVYREGRPAILGRALFPAGSVATLAALENYRIIGGVR